MGPCALSYMTVTVVMPVFVNEGLKRGSEATESGGGYAGRDILKFRVALFLFPLFNFQNQPM